MPRVYVHAWKFLLGGRWESLSSCIIGRSWNFVQVLMPTTLGGVKRDEVEEFLEEIDNDATAKELAEKKADDSFSAYVIAKAKKYSVGTSLIVAGVLGELVVPGNPISPGLITKGVEQILDAWWGTTPPPPSQPTTSVPPTPPAPSSDAPKPPPQPPRNPSDEEVIKGREGEGGDDKATPGKDSPPISPATEEVMAAFRQVTRGRGSLEREELLKEVSIKLGYQRLGPKIEEALRGHLRAAIRRKIIEADGKKVRAGTTKMADYEVEDLRDAFASVMRKRTRYEREDVMRAIIIYLGFTSLTDTSRDALRSAITSGIRQKILGYECSMIWREK